MSGLASPARVPRPQHGGPQEADLLLEAELVKGCEAALMGRTTYDRTR